MEVGTEEKEIEREREIKRLLCILWYDRKRSSEERLIVNRRSVRILSLLRISRSWFNDDWTVLVLLGVLENGRSSEVVSAVKVKKNPSLRLTSYRYLPEFRQRPLALQFTSNMLQAYFLLYYWHYCRAIGHQQRGEDDEQKPKRCPSGGKQPVPIVFLIERIMVLFSGRCWTWTAWRPFNFCLLSNKYQ